MEGRGRGRGTHELCPPARRLARERRIPYRSGCPWFREISYALFCLEPVQFMNVPFLFFLASHVADVRLAASPSPLMIPYLLKASAMQDALVHVQYLPCTPCTLLFLVSLPTRRHSTRTPHLASRIVQQLAFSLGLAGLPWLMVDRNIRSICLDVGGYACVFIMGPCISVCSRLLMAATWRSLFRGYNCASVRPQGMPVIKDQSWGYPKSLAVTTVCTRSR